jgi:hypothetical protein
MHEGRHSCAHGADRLDRALVDGPYRADGRDRTGDIRFTRAVLYQLSYVGLV